MQETENRTPDLQWSVYFQNPDFLERTRLFLIRPEYAPLVRAWCGIRDGVRFLDVGCGTGYFTRLLMGGEERVSAVGLDLEAPFIEAAGKLYREAFPAGEKADAAAFMTGNALELPFPDGSFDLVVSHTFFTSIPDPKKAMDEMKRVLKPGGTVASVTTMSFYPQGIEGGRYPEECAWHKELQQLTGKVYNAYQKLDPLKGRTGGVKPSALPRFFAESGLKHVSAYPIGKFFSLSNAAVTLEEKERWIYLYRASEEKKLDAFLALPEMREYLAAEDAERYRGLVIEKCEWLKSHLGENEIWDWQGGANLLLTGIRA